MSQHDPCAAIALRKIMADSNDPTFYEGALKYLGTLTVGILVFLFGWLGKWALEKLAKRFEKYLSGLDDAVKEVQKVGAQMLATQEAIKRVEQNQESLQNSQEHLYSRMEDFEKRLREIEKKNRA